MRRRLPGITVLLLALAGCVPTVPPEAPPPVEPTTPVDAAARAQAVQFLEVLAVVEPVAEAVCRERSRVRNCDFLIVIDDRPDQPPNAFQTLDRRGRPVIGFTLALISDARNPDELAFVMGHEAAHHIAGHIPRRQDEAINAALLAGVQAQAGGANPEEVRAAQTLGAEVAARSYSREFELEADALGAEIALLAGFDPIKGSGFFDRLPGPRNLFLSTHPATKDRKAVVAATVRRLTGG